MAECSTFSVGKDADSNERSLNDQKRRITDTRKRPRDVYKNQLLNQAYSAVHKPSSNEA